MFASVLARRAKRHVSHVHRLIRAGKLAAEMRPTRHGRRAAYVTTRDAEAIAIVSNGRGGWHKRQHASASKGGGILADFAAYRAIAPAKRSILVKLAAHDVATLRLLVALAK